MNNLSVDNRYNTTRVKTEGAAGYIYGTQTYSNSPPFQLIMQNVRPPTAPIAVYALRHHQQGSSTLERWP